jgi:hypothetical protein
MFTSSHWTLVHTLLVRLYVLLHERIEVQQQQLVRVDHTRYKIGAHDFDLEPIAGMLESSKQLFCETLWVVDQLQGRKVRRNLLLLLLGHLLFALHNTETREELMKHGGRRVPS